MILPITLTVAAAATLLNIWIARRVGQARIAHKVSIGDGGNTVLTARMRAHSNYTEYTPFFLILLLLIEMAKGSELWLWVVGAVYIIARIAHVYGMEARGKPGKLRLVGILTTMLVLLGLSLYAIYVSYMETPGSRGRSEAPVTRAAAPRV
jgi:uncharacterized membrane protein YecN with MAPEG domain